MTIAAHPTTPAIATGVGAPGVRSRTIDTPVGPMLACATCDALCMLEFTDRPALPRQRADVRRLFGAEPVEDAHPALDSIARELAEYFAGARTRFETPLVAPGSAWERAVWDQLLAIPYGETRCYEDIAIALGMPGASRAVGLANGRNRIAIVIPCHRVIQKGGGLRGYGGGLWRKSHLLGLEAKVSGATFW